MGYATHSRQLGTLHILLQRGCVLSEKDQQHILRIRHNDQQPLDELLAVRGSWATRSTFGVVDRTVSGKRTNLTCASSDSTS